MFWKNDSARDDRKYGIHIIRKNVQDGLAIIVKVYDTFLLVTAFHTLHSKTFLS